MGKQNRIRVCKKKSRNGFQAVPEGWPAYLKSPVRIRHAVHRLKCRLLVSGKKTGIYCVINIGVHSQIFSYNVWLNK